MHTSAFVLCCHLALTKLLENTAINVKFATFVRLHTVNLGEKAFFATSIAIYHN